MSKPRVAFFDFASCEGCQLQIVNLEEAVVDVVKLIDIVSFREVMSNSMRSAVTIFQFALQASATLWPSIPAAPVTRTILFFETMGNPFSIFYTRILHGGLPNPLEYTIILWEQLKRFRDPFNLLGTPDDPIFFAGKDAQAIFRRRILCDTSRTDRAEDAASGKKRPSGGKPPCKIRVITERSST